MKRILAFCLLCITLEVFAVTVKRPNDFKGENMDDLPLKYYNNIFEKYQWTIPQMMSSEIIFTSNGDLKEGSVKFGSKELLFVMDKAGKIGLKGSSTFVEQEKSAKDIYYNINELRTIMVPVERLVTKTRYVTNTVPVQKSRLVTKTRQVSSMGPNGSTTWRTESYTETEWYTDYETRTVPETYTVWETVMEPRLDIPVYYYYTIPLDEQRKIFIIRSNGSNKYYFVNPGFYIAKMTEKDFFGGYDVNVLLLDTNSNGIYNDKDDTLLLSAWNPYDKSSKFRAMVKYMGNYWYRLSELEQEKMITVAFSDDASSISIVNANKPYQGSKKKGKLLITGIPKEGRKVYINGKRYFQNGKGVLARAIEYGVYKIRIENEFHIPYETMITIDDNSSKSVIDYQETDPAGMVVFSSDLFDKWILIFTDKNGNKKFYYNSTTVNLAPGVYKMDINSGSSVIGKEITVEADKEININYQDVVDSQQ